MTEVPEDVWRYTAQFIPKHILRNLYEVNRAFFDMAMNERYREVSLFQFDNRMLYLLERLSCPSIGSRIRVLRLRPYFIQELIYLQQRDLHGSTSIVSSLFSLFRNLSNLREYHLQWNDLPLISKLSLDFLILPFISSDNLRTLSLEMSLEKFQALFASLSECMPLCELALEDLTITLRHGGDGPANNVTDGALLASTLAPFIIQSQSNGTLRSFTFQSTHAQDSSHLFRALSLSDVQDQPAMSNLQSLTLSIPTPSPQLGNPSALASFISAHSETLTDLTLRGQWEHYFALGLPGPSDMSFSPYIETCFSQVALPNLTSLTIATTSYSLTTSVRVVSRFVNSLKELDLTGRYTTFDDVEELVRVFSLSSAEQARPLEVLQIGPVTLSPELVDLLAEGFPKLKELNMKIRDVVPNKDDTAIYHGIGRLVAGRKLRTQKQEQIESFFQQMRTRVYRNWSLERISVWKLNTRWQFQTQYATMFARCVPSIRFPESVAQRASAQVAVSLASPLSMASSAVSSSSSASSSSSGSAITSATTAATTSPLSSSGLGNVFTADVSTVCGWCQHGSGPFNGGSGPGCGC
ncbi:hypothetical protein VKT23_000352 [Stygiomarasmius scandens]|uniref:F-box domain-containing protein n=1 Tax=Marasmiellus scandens TaxID=2682957 RepID=A0ABR1K9T1_9AGAR